jgi:hypothetical protein
MHLNPAPGLGQPFLNEHGMVVSGIVKKDVNEPLGGIQQRDRYQQRDRAQGVNRRRFDHTGCARFQIDGAGAGGEAGGKGIPGA